MSSLYKLSIQGVRSFDPESSETIEFGFPLTLICGQNGCGKTTIIECLKYATTGDLPPNSKGGTFVNDPSIAARNTVNAQVKLAFQNANGKSMICTRTMQLTKKRGKGVTANTFKTLEGQLAVMDGGHKATISTKNAELDSQIPIYLGASRAILDYVIFCHQDDSLWPLSEASVLKKRFDDIFEALKFTRVLESLNSIKKDMATDIKLIEQNVQHLRVDKTRANKIRAKAKLMSVNCDALSKEITDLTVAIEDKEREAEALFASNQSFQEILSKYDQLQYSQKTCQQQLDRLAKNVEILPDPDSDLIHRLDNFDAHLEEKFKEAKTKNQQLSSVEHELSTSRGFLNQVIRAEGAFKVREELYHTNSDKLRKLIVENHHGDFKSREMDLDERLLEVENKLTQSIDSYHRLLEANKSAIEQASTRVYEASENLTKSNQNHIYNRNEITTLETQIREGKKKLTAQQQQTRDLEVHKRDLSELEAGYNQKLHVRDIQTLDKQVESERAQLALFEAHSETLSRKIAQVAKQSDTFSKISFIKEEMLRKKAAISALEEELEQSVMKTSHGSISGDTDLKEILSNLKSRHDLKTKESQNITKAVDMLVAKVENFHSQIKEIRNSADDLQKNISKVIEKNEIDTYEQVLRDVEDNHQDALESLNTFDITKEFKIKAIEIAKTEKYCTLCQRRFDSPGLSKFLQELESNVQSVSAEDLRKEVEQTAKELEQVKSINPLILKLRQYSHELPELEAKKNKEEQQLSGAEKLRVKIISELEKLSEEVRALETLKAPCDEISRLKKEVVFSQDELSSLEEQLNDYGSVNEKNPIQLQKEVDELNRKMKELRNSINDLVEEKYVKQREFSRVEGKIKDKRLLVSELERSLIDQEHEKATIVSYEKQVKELLGKTQKMEQEVGELLIIRDEEKKKMQALETENHVSEMKKEAEMNRVQKLRDELFTLCQQVKEYENHDVGAYSKHQDQVKSATTKVQDLETKLHKIQQEIKVLEKTISEANNLKGQIRENLDYRRLQNESMTIESEINQLDVEDAHHKRNEYNQKTKEIRLEATALNSEHAGKVGEVKQLRDQIRALKDDLESEYVNVNERYQEEWVKLQTNMLATNDLQTYSKALDNAIMKYHSHKMESINRILNELWKQTYKGTDVDTIAIKSDINLQAKGSRSYNYRVVMYKQDCELDMRGRCSAGQKVLTSILIRLALAECFGSNCGIIALDEPTTNLDVENTESLAQSLNNIIEFRRGQKNFQLIVITHDEKFLSHIGGEQFTDNFYRVQRDENQKSIIRSLPINFILE